jgi:hypothetical protein
VIFTIIKSMFVVVLFFFLLKIINKLVYILSDNIIVQMREMIELYILKSIV